MTSPPIDLFVAWQDHQGRGIYPVARLRQTSRPAELYEFRYIHGAELAQAHGFKAFASFPRLDEVYRSKELFAFFKNRIMPPSRPDYAGYVTELGLTVETAQPLELLARSGGLRATDRLEIYAAPRTDANTSTLRFLLRGVRHLPDSTETRIAALAAGEQLFVMRDVQNPHNHRALLLRSHDKINLGYIPDLLVDDLTQLDLSGQGVRVVVEKVNPPPAPVRHRVLCQLQAEWPASRRPFASERFEPITAEADASFGYAKAAT